MSERVGEGPNSEACTISLYDDDDDEDDDDDDDE